MGTHYPEAAVQMLSARKFTRDVSAAKRAAEHAPVVITERGEPAYVLLSIEEYRRLVSCEESLVERLSMDDEKESDIEFKAARIKLRAPDL